MDNVERLDWHDLLKVNDDAPADLLSDLDKYFKPFAARQEGDTCLKCGSDLLGLLGTFQWGLVHGEGNCSSCGWPARMYHFPKDKDGEEIFALRNVLLQYHPDFVSPKE